GVDNLLVRLSKCCNPVPGDKVVGYITKGRGVSVHRANCSNVQTEEAKKRYIEVKWLDDESASELYDIDLEITGYDRRGLLNDVSKEVNKMNTKIPKTREKTDTTKMSYVQQTIPIHNTKHLKRIVDLSKQIKDVYTVTRVIH